MFTPAIHSSSNYPNSQLIQSSALGHEEIYVIASNESPHSQAVPHLPPELIEKILYLLVIPYEPMKSIFNLYAAQHINKEFHRSVVNFLNDPLSNFLNLAKNEIAILIDLKNAENAIKGALQRTNIEVNIVEYGKLYGEFAKIRNGDVKKIVYEYNFMQNEAKNVCINFYQRPMDDCRYTLEILSKRKNIEDISIIADSTFSVCISTFLEKLKLIFYNNINIAKINYLSLRRSSINSASNIKKLEQTLSNRNITTLDLSENLILDKYALDLAIFFQTIMVENLHLSAIGVSTKGLQNIINALPANLKYLNLSNNNIKPHEANFLYGKLRASKMNMECIYLNESDFSEYEHDQVSRKNKKHELLEFIFDN